MKRTNSVTDALNNNAADLDLGDGLVTRIPLGDVGAVITEAIASAEGRSAMLALGPKVVSRDSDGTPYYNPTSGTLRIFVGADGKPFFAEKPWPTTSLDPDGVPAVIL